MSNPLWSFADLHLHTTASDGTATPREVLEWVRDRTDLSVVAITDHNTIDGALEAAELAKHGEYRVEVIVGQEVESADGHIIGLWTPERVPIGMSAEETVAAIHEQGGFAVAAHPFAPRWWHKHGLCRGEVEIYDSVAFDGFEIANSTPLLFNANPLARMYYEVNRRRLAATGGSDAHILAAIGSSRTVFRGSSGEDLRRCLEARETTARGPGFSVLRGLLYARKVPEIKRRDVERRVREIEAGIRAACDPSSRDEAPTG